MRKARTNSLHKGSSLRRAVEDFFCSDKVSRLTTGKKQTVTLKGRKEQKRLLTDTMDSLHKQFLNDYNSLFTISYSAFCKLRPFWVREPTKSERDTCLCKKHENFDLLLQFLHQIGAIETPNSRKVLEPTTCSINSKACMYSECEICRDKLLPLKLVKPLDHEFNLPRWDMIVNDAGFKITAKIDTPMTFQTIVQRLHVGISEMKKHVFNMFNQMSGYRQVA
jgi:hypothetical protein